MTSVVCQELGRDYPRRQGALDEVTFEVGAGQILGVLGPNGAGKTSLMRVLGALLTPSRGSASVAGTDIRRDPQSVRYGVGLMLGDAGFYEGMTTRDYLHFFARAYGVKRRSAVAQVDHMLTEFDLTRHADDALATMSQGNRQRVSLARCLLHDPPVLLLDEPTANLDPGAARAFQARIRLQRAAGKTIIYCTHDLTEAEEIADKVLILEQGRARAYGSVDQLRSDSAVGHSHVTIAYDGASEAAVAAAAGAHATIIDSQPGLLVVDARTGEDVSLLLGSIICAGGLVREVTRSRDSLEQLYFALVDGRRN